MAANLLSIASSGVAAASAALDVTSQNIANASTPGYVRESVSQIELAAPNGTGLANQRSGNGVLVTGVTRNVSAFLQGQVYATGAAAAAADSGVANLTHIESAVEQSNLYPSITGFQGSLQQLSSNPTDPSLRATVLADAQNMAQSFNLASSSLASAVQGMQSDAAGGVAQVNVLAQNLAQLNQQIAGDPNVATNGAALLDQRDALLQSLSSYTGFTASTAANGTVSVQLGGASGPSLVSGSTASTLASTTAANGTLAFTLGGTSLTIAGGSIGADAQGLTSAVAATSSLNTIATSLITSTNTTQAAGADLKGNAGAAMFSGSGAGDIAVAMTDPATIATAAAGSPAGSRDTTNLTALQAALNTNGANGAGTAGDTNALLIGLSSATASATTAQTALDTLASQAKSQLAAQAGVNLNTEAANLLQYQQAFQASGKVIAVAQTLFNQLIQI